MRTDYIFGFYKKYISPINPPSCRFYPTCSCYADTQFRFQNPLLATIKTLLRILRCNQLFNGGIDYPVVKYKIQNTKILNTNKKQKNIDFWLIPKDKNNFYVIKSLRKN